nr:alpha/beta fold hydrolase [Enterococcus sp. CU12B]
MKKMNKWWKRFLIVLLVLVIGILVGNGYIKKNTYRATESALMTSQLGKVENKIVVFEGKKENPALIFYPGAFVERESYSIWAEQISEAGYSVYLVQMPFNLAVLNADAAEQVIADNQLEDVILVGHSLGGVMASRFTHNHENVVKGIVYLASYPDEKGSLLDFKGAVLSITGENDGVLNQEKYEEAKAYLPKQTSYRTIAGGNHAGFGSYGAQKGDKKATISNADQQNKVSELIIEWLNEQKE